MKKLKKSSKILFLCTGIAISLIVLSAYANAGNFEIAKSAAVKYTNASVTCRACNGSGKCYSCHGAGNKTCLGCGGTGKNAIAMAANVVMQAIATQNGTTFTPQDETCTVCNGSGKVSCIMCNGTGVCPVCNGTGQVPH